jgi:hypothetical protein
MNADEFRELFETNVGRDHITGSRRRQQVLALGIESILRRLDRLEGKQRHYKSALTDGCSCGKKWPHA